MYPVQISGELSATLTEVSFRLYGYMTGWYPEISLDFFIQILIYPQCIASVSQYAIQSLHTTQCR